MKDVITTLHSESGNLQVAEGQVIALFAFDVGYEVSLEKLHTVASAVPIQPLTRKKQTPTFLQYSRPPRVLDLGSCQRLVERPGRVQATVFDFGVVSISFRWSLEPGLALSELPAISQQIYEMNLLVEARECVRSLMEKIESAIKRPSLSNLVEDYYLFVVEKFNQQVLARDLLQQHSSTLAQTLRFETRALSASQQQDALGQQLTYYKNDLLLIDWNAAFIYDQDFTDTVLVLELLNVELLEARHIDDELDSRTQRYADLAYGRTGWPIPLRTPFRQEVRDLTELRVEAGLLAERVGNSLKLIGDLFLARVYSAAAERFHLHEWEKIVAHKLDMIDRFYQMVTDRARTAQSQALEIAIIILILVELVLAIVRH